MGYYSRDAQDLSNVFPIPVSPTAMAIRRAEALLQAAGVKAKVVRTAPDWKPGDVVVVRYSGDALPYTYVRGRAIWPGERTHKTDAQMDVLYAAGKLTPVLQAGGTPFDKGRL